MRIFAKSNAKLLKNEPSSRNIERYNTWQRTFGSIGIWIHKSIVSDEIKEMLLRSLIRERKPKLVTRHIRKQISISPQCVDFRPPASDDYSQELQGLQPVARVFPEKDVELILGVMYFTVNELKERPAQRQDSTERKPN